jgi:tetratricopeptide (TPR) repeat protein/2-polyprenyl-3-methyl-5-hydroxy-6-metoxy-1,4-benzoquinol methylase
MNFLTFGVTGIRRMAAVRGGAGLIGLVMGRDQQTRPGQLPLQGARPAERLFDLAVEHHRAGQLDMAEQFYRDCLAADPRHADGFNCLGLLFFQRGQNQTALDLISNAIAIKARNPAYHYNIGLVFAALGRMDDAIEHNRRAVALQPDHADAHTNLAGALAARGQWGDAVLHFRRALSRKPNIPVAYSNLAGALRAEGKPEEALGVVARGLAVEETDDLKGMFCLCARELRSAPKIDRLRPLVVQAITQCWTRPSELATFAIALVKKSASVQSDPLLRCLLKAAPINDVALERALTTARRSVLDLARIDTEELAFHCALAHQCFINEYVFDVADDEVERVVTLRDALSAALKTGDFIPASMLVAVASYFPLHSVPGSQALLDRPWPEPVMPIIIQQVREPAEEQTLRASIPARTPIASDVSRTVRQQYEESPYPRWIGAGTVTRSMAFDDHIRLQFPHLDPGPARSNTDILIAGCGTGQQAIEAATQYAGATTLAVDLSLASLAYAKRKTAEIGIGSIEYAQADILELASLGRDFDVIEAIGVLHHLADPWAGWRTLLSILRPGGYMRVALYRALGRDAIIAAQAMIAERGYGVADIRRCRQVLIGLDETATARGVLKYQDFYATSECRDLLFHVQEQATTIPAIESFLAENGIAFVGFDGVKLGEYAKRHPDDRAMTDLKRWHILEVEDPAVFVSMYEFWVRKPA